MHLYCVSTINYDRSLGHSSPVFWIGNSSRNAGEQKRLVFSPNSFVNFTNFFKKKNEKYATKFPQICIHKKKYNSFS